MSYEASLAAPLILLMIDSALKGKMWMFLIWGCLLASAKETYPLMFVAMGVYLILYRRPRLALLATCLGAAWFYVDMAVVIPWFRDNYAVFPTDFEHFAPFAQFGTSPGSILLNAALHPLELLGTLAQPGKLEFLVTLIAPYLILGFAGSALWILALPELAITFLSNHPNSNTVLLAGARFSMVTAGALALACAHTIGRLKTAAGLPAVGFQRALSSACLFITLALIPLWFNAAQWMPLSSASDIARIQTMVGPTAAAAVPYNVAALFAERPIILDIDRNPPAVIANCAQYVVLRRNTQTELARLIADRAFTRIWQGDELDLWRSPNSPSCSPAAGSWMN